MGEIHRERRPGTVPFSQLYGSVHTCTDFNFMTLFPRFLRQVGCRFRPRFEKSGKCFSEKGI